MTVMDTRTFPGLLQDLADIKADQARLVGELLAQQVPISTILSRLSEINDGIHQIVLDEAIATMIRRGREDPPVSITLLVMGSLGRGEAFLGPDQDNAFILGDYTDEDHARIDDYFIPLAEAFNASLNRIGYPLCTGHVMARNPVWRKSERSWFDQMQRWSMRRGPVAARFGDLLFDFRPVAGPMRPAYDLRHHLSQMLRENPGPLFAMCHETPPHRVAVGFFGRLKSEGIWPEASRVDLKSHGLLPLIFSARLWALRHGIEETSTRARLARLATLHVIEAESGDALTAAFDSLAGIILRQQIRDLASGRPATNFVEPTLLDDRHRAALIDGLHVIDNFAKETRAIFAGELY